jgi:hypothetical protein
MRKKTEEEEEKGREEEEEGGIYRNVVYKREGGCGRG